MKKFANPILGLLFVVLLGLGALVGQRENRLREAEQLYRWMISVSTQVRVFGDDLVPDSAENEDYLDEELYAQLVEVSEQHLEDIPVDDDDYLDGDKVLPKVARYVAPPSGEEIDEAQESGAILTEGQIARDKRLWQLALSPAMDDLRQAYLDALKNDRIYSSGTTFGRSDLYSAEGGTVSLANMFFGFRRMAANLLWLEVDNFWHEGKIHRMVPLMNTTVMLDPSFVDAYLLGAWHLAYNQTAKMESTPWEMRKFDREHRAWVGAKESLYYSAIDFLQDGIRKNPRNYKLYFDAGFAIYDEKLDDQINAERYVAEAIQLDHDRWVRRTLYRLQGENGMYRESRDGWQNYAERFPENVVAPRFVEQMDGMILEKEAEYESIRTKMAAQLARHYTEQGDTQTAAEWQARADEHEANHERMLDAAYDHWNRRAHSGNRIDSFAESRAVRIKAMRLAEEGRHLEAIAELDYVRMESDDFFWEGTEMMMDYKQEAGIPLELTEIKKLRNDEIQQNYVKLLPRMVEKQVYVYEQGRWAPEGYADQPYTELNEGDIALLQICYENPRIRVVVNELPGDILFQAGGDWYLRHADTPPDVPVDILEDMGHMQG